MRLAVTSIVLGGCSDEFGQTPTECSWEAPQNIWPAAAPPECAADLGYEPGQTVPDLRLMDQYGDQVAPWQFHGSLILLDVSTMWCGPCQDLGERTEEIWQDYKDQGFVYLTVLHQDFERAPAVAADLNEWIELNWMTSPVLADPNALTKPAIEPAGSYPGVLLVGRDLKVIQRLSFLESEIRAAIEANL